MEWLLHHESDPDIDEPLPPSTVNESESNRTSTKSQGNKSGRRREFVPNKKVRKVDF
jgi:uncharacterized UBP type Zn finger protein